jgi:predicted house-cleaning noncanonical NTP pyrophosphatase (MazG superfamily)
MECVREIIDTDKLIGIIQIPEEIRKSKVEVIVLPVEDSQEKLSIKDKLQAVEELNGLISDQSKEKLDEFELIINQRNPFRRNPVQL